jgi:hypothetical protein
MKFEISKMTIYFTIGLILIIGCYYYIQYRNKKNKINKDNTENILNENIKKNNIGEYYE